MARKDGVKFGDFGPRAAHLCVDAQRMFSEKID